jgi:cysteine dioxygenase
MKNPISLDRFILAMARRPVDELDTAEFVDLVTSVHLSDDLITQHTRFCAPAYARNLVCRTPSFELLVLCWMPGQHTTIHDHCGALNTIIVHSGELTSRVYEQAGAPATPAGPARLAGEETVDADGHTTVDRGGIHRLANESGRDLVTVHFYAPPLTTLTVYSESAAETELVTMRYTLADDFE